MAKMKWGADVDWDGLEEEEYEEGEDFEPYDGPIPGANVVLRGEIKKVWAVKSQAGDWMLKVIFEAAGNTGDRKEYDGLGIWDNVLWELPQVKFRWQPFLDALGITLRDLKTKTVTDPEDDNVGTPVLRIGSVKFPTPVRIKTGKKQKYEGEWMPRIGRFLAPVDEELEDDEDDEDDDETPF